MPLGTQVFFGPPYHSMPFSEKVNYAEVGVFFNSTDYKDWLIKDFQWKLDPNIRAEHETEARWCARALQGMSEITYSATGSLIR